MATSDEQRAARDAKLDALHERLAAAVGQLSSGDDWRRALEFAARFRSRSFGNTLLIWAQHLDAFEQGRVSAPEPSYVAGYRQWQSLGRQVEKGQPGYMIFAPVTGRFASSTPQDSLSWRRLGRFEKPKPGEAVRSRMVGAKPAYVWDVSQTTGDPIPERVAPVLLEGAAPDGLWEGLVGLIEAEGFAVLRVEHAGLIHGANGLTDYTNHTVAVRMDMDDAAQVKTLAHELAHVRLHGPDNPDATRHRGIGEVEAESVALMIGAAHGMDTSSYTIPYVSGWAGTVKDKDPAEAVQATGERGYRARARWTDPSTKKRVGRVSHVRTMEEVEEFFDQMRKATETGTDSTVTLSAYAASIGDRWQRGLDPTSTAELYDTGLRLRVLPALGHVRVAKITAGMIDRTIDGWEAEHSASTIKNSIAPLVRVLDEAVRDDIISINPAKHRARRNLGRHVTHTTGALRQYALPDLPTLRKLADACGQVHQSCSDHVILAALLAARGSEVAGLRAGDVDWDNRIVWIRRQHYPGRGGLVIKQTKGRRDRPVPMLDALEPVLERLTAGKQPDDPLLRGPRGGVLTTATVRDATHWDDLVKRLGFGDLTRHGLRHTGATWMADAGIALHVLQEILGHQSIETTKGYLHPDHRHLAEAARQANQFLSAAPVRKDASRRDGPRL